MSLHLGMPRILHPLSAKHKRLLVDRRGDVRIDFLRQRETYRFLNILTRRPSNISQIPEPSLVEPGPRPPQEAADALDTFSRQMQLSLLAIGQFVAHSCPSADRAGGHTGATIHPPGHQHSRLRDALQKQPPKCSHSAIPTPKRWALRLHDPAHLRLAQSCPQRGDTRHHLSSTPSQ